MAAAGPLGVAPRRPPGAGDRRVLGRRHRAPVGVGRRPHGAAQHAAPCVRRAAVGLDGQPVPDRSPVVAARSPATDGEEMRPASVRLPADRAARWLRSLPHAAMTDSLRWLVAVADLGRATVAAGLVAPQIRTDRDMPVARWVPVPDQVVDVALADLAARCRRSACPRRRTRRRSSTSMPRWSTRWPATASSSGTGRRRCRAVGIPAMMAARSVMRALGGLDPLIGGSGVAHPDELAALAARFERHERRLRGEPVVLPRVRLVVPDDPYDDWDVRLELVDEVDPAGGARRRTSGTPRRRRGGRRRGGSPGPAGGGGQHAGDDRRRVRRRRRRPRQRARADRAGALGRGRRALPRAGAGRAGGTRHRARRSRTPRAGGRPRQRSGDAPRRRRSPEAIRARGGRRLEAGRGRRRRPGGDLRRRAGAGRARRAPRCCTAGGGGCASIRRRCAAPASCSRSRSANMPWSMRSRC